MLIGLWKLLWKCVRNMGFRQGQETNQLLQASTVVSSKGHRDITPLVQRTSIHTAISSRLAPATTHMSHLT
jgi:hypothetical protein